MRRPRPHLLCTAAVLATAAAAAPPAAAATPQVRALRSLQHSLRRDLTRAGGAGSALVLDATTGRTLFSVAATAPRVPASVEKLYTTATALLELGPNATLRTRVLGAGNLTADGIWHGKLYLRGGGDPTFGDATFDHAAYDTGATVQALAAALSDAGVRGVSGSIEGDESYFDSVRGTPATHYRPDLELEGELSALAYDGGFESAYETSLQHRPALFATQAFVTALRAAGISVPRRTTRVYVGRTPPGAQTLASVASPTVTTLIELTNSPSDNFFAEMLLKDLGARFGGAGTTAAGAAVVRRFIARRFGLYPRLNDGSGLSRYDRSTAAGVVALLRAMQDSIPFQASLAVAGVRGTMQDEMLRTRAVDNCRGKTGTLSDAANLVGYCTAADGEQLIFAFFLNGIANTYAGHRLEDRMGVALANYDPQTGQG